MSFQIYDTYCIRTEYLYKANSAAILCQSQNKEHFNKKTSQSVSVFVLLKRDIVADFYHC